MPQELYSLGQDSPLLSSIRYTSDERWYHGHILSILLQTSLHLALELLNDIMEFLVLEEESRLEARA
jgi:hypothetical protein